MIIFADNNVVPYLLMDREQYFLLNLYNTTNLGTRLDRLLPPNMIMKTVELDSIHFDSMYVNYILSNDEVFVDFMEIPMAMYYNNDVLILTDLQSTVVSAMYEVIIKLIQYRYGYSCFIASTPEDLLYIPESEMSEAGYNVFMADKERYTYLTVDADKLLANIELVGAENDRCI